MDFVSLCLEAGAAKAAQIATERLTFSEEFRGYCEQNVCGRYGKNYTCPPHVGEIGSLIAALRRRKTAVVWQTIHTLEDSYDFEGMMRGQQRHNEITLQIARQARQRQEDVLVLGAGGCFLCECCGAETGQPCPFPQQAISSLEAYGIDVSGLEAVTALKYINGVNTVTYFSGLFFS